MTDLSGGSSSPTLRSRGIKNKAILLIRGVSESTRKQLRDDPMGFSRKLLYYMWFFIVLLSVLSLLGYNINPFAPSVDIGPLEHSLQSTTPDTSEEEVKIEQVLVKSKKHGKKYEISFACDEVTCVENCARRVTKKCKKSEHCLATRAKECKKKCRKKRCENRCKDQAMSYVEREMKLEQCKEACGSSKPEKCKNKCINMYQPCKAKCRAELKKYQCDREPVLPTAVIDEGPASSGDDGGGGSAETFDVETETDV